MKNLDEEKKTETFTEVYFVFLVLQSEERFYSFGDFNVIMIFLLLIAFTFDYLKDKYRQRR